MILTNNRKYFVIALLILVPYSIWMQIHTVKKGKKLFVIFNSNEFDSQIESVSISYKGFQFRLIDGREFVFYPYTDKKLNEGKIFEHIAKKGDRVVKKAFSDTLYLYKGNKKLAYTFIKFSAH